MSAGSGRWEQEITSLKGMLVQLAMQEAHGNVTHAARYLGVDRTYMYRILRAFGPGLRVKP